MAKREFDVTRVDNDVNGNPRYVVHFLEMLDDDERNSNFLQWARVKFNLAYYRAKSAGGRDYKGKDFGGGIVFTSYDIQGDCNTAFTNFEASRKYVQAHNDMALVVVNDFELYTRALNAMKKVYEHKYQAPNAFAEIMDVCDDAAIKYKKRSSFESRYIAAAMVVCQLEEGFK